MTYQRHPTIDHYLNKVRKHDVPYTAVVREKEILIFPGVMSPKYDRSAQIFISLMSWKDGERFLDIGSGTGIISLFAAENGAREIVAVDINKAAVKNTEENFKKHAIENGTVLHSNLFEKVEGVFDTIFFNAPFHGNLAADELELGTSDHNYQTLRRFFAKAKEYMSPGARLVLGFSDTGDNDLVGQVAEAAGFVCTELKKQVNGDWTAHLYSFRVKE